MLKLIYVMTALLTFFSMFSRAEEETEMLFFYGNYPPFCYVENDQVKGLFVDVVTAVFDDMDSVYQTKYYPFKRALHSAKQGDGLVAGILKTAQRQKYLDYSSPFYIEKSMIFVNNNASFPFRSISDLAGKRIGVKLGWSYGEAFDQARHKQLFTPIVGEEIQLYTLLKAGRIDAVIGNEFSAPILIKEMQLEAVIEALPNPLLITGLRIAAKKGTKQQVLERFNIHLKRIKSSGLYEKIINKYY